MTGIRKWALRSSALIVFSLVGLLLAGAGGGIGYFFGNGGFAGLNTDKGALDVKVAGKKLFSERVEASVDVPSGLLTFDSATPDPVGYTLLLVQMPNGVAITDYLDGLAAMANTGTNDTEAAAKFNMSNFGGARIAGTLCQVNFTVVLQPGTYYLLAFHGAGISDPSPKAQEIRVTGSASNAKLPDAQNKIVMDEGDGPPRFITSEQWPADGTFLVTNNTALPTEAVFIPLKQDATDQDLKSWFTADSPNYIISPFSSFRVCGMAPVSTGRSVLVHFTSPPGEYALASFVFNPKYNKRQYQLGMYKRITITSLPQ